MPINALCECLKSVQKKGLDPRTQSCMVVIALWVLETEPASDARTVLVLLTGPSLYFYVFNFACGLNSSSSIY